jgi:hypothetical protein
MVFLHELVEGLVAEVQTQSKPQLQAVLAVPTEKSGKEDLIIYLVELLELMDIG